MHREQDTTDAGYNRRGHNHEWQSFECYNANTTVGVATGPDSGPDVAVPL